MDSHSDREEHESGAKRIKLDFGVFSTGVLCNGDGFSNFSASAAAQIHPSEGVSPDSDSGYEASTMESIPTPSHLTSPRTDMHESLSSTSEGFHQTPIDIFNLDTSQNSIDADDDIASTISSLSELSGFSELSGQEWKPMITSQAWDLSQVHKQMMKGVNPRSLLMELGVEIGDIPQFVDSMTLWKLIINMFAEPPPRSKLRHVNTLDDVVRLLKGAKNVIVLTGAGVSVSCGIPDFRSRDGIYSRLAMDFPDLPDPQAMFDISYFNQDPRPFYKFARDIYPGKFQPSPCHRFIKLLENHNKLLRNYTQNIDTLEKVAEIEKVIECHGSFATATCTKCSYQVTAEDIRDVVLAQNVPVCEKCQPHVGRSIGIAELKGREPDELRDLVSAGIMKPDIVFFGEGLPDTFHEAMVDDKDKCDLLLVIGSSLKVRPVALIPTSLPPEVPQILINRETLQHCRFDVELLGDCDVIINYICQLLGSSWDGAVYHPELLRETLRLMPWEKDKSEQGSSDKSNQSISSSCSYDSGSPKINISTQCKCNVGTNNDSSLSPDFQNAEVIMCNCPKQTSIDKKLSKTQKSEGKLTSFKERHMSIDSARDSGIGENSNFTDGNFDEISDVQPQQSEFKEIYNEGSPRTSELDPQMAEVKNPPDIENSDSKFAFAEGNDSSQVATTETDLRGFWQPKQKRSLTERLPANSFYLIVPSRYIFPGAEVYYDPDEKCNYFDDTSTSSESSDGEDESENESPDVSF